MKSDPCAKKPDEFHSEIDIKVTDFLLTPLACATLINEIFKNLLYQKSQIPYTYSWLKAIVNKKRQKIEQQQEGNKPNNFQIMNHFRTVSSTYDAINTITTSIINELKSPTNQLKEVVFLFGVTPFCPKEVFTIRVSALALGHSESHHEAETSRKKHKVLRDIFLSENWTTSIDNSLPCTNIYIFLRYTGNSGSSYENSEIFVASKPLFVPPKVKHTVINLNYDDTHNSRHLCCGNFQVFKDMNTPVKKPLPVDNLDNVIDTEEEEFWAQSKFLIQGFKDCFINKVPACELW